MINPAEIYLLGSPPVYGVLCMNHSGSDSGAPTPNSAKRLFVRL